MNIKKLVKLNFLIIIFLVVSIFLINSIVLEKLKENQYSKKEISKLVFMQENMNFLVKDIIDTENLKELEELKNEFLIYEKKFEKIKNYLFIKDKDDFLDLLIKDIHKHPNVEKHLILLSKSEKDIEKYFDNIFEMQKRKIELKTLFLQDYPKESLLRKNIEKEILQTKDLNIIKHFSDIKYYSKEVLFQHKEDKYLNILLEKIYSLQKIYPNNQLSEYIDIIKTISAHALELEKIEKEEKLLQNNISKTVKENKVLNLKIENEIEKISSNFSKRSYSFIISLLLVTIILIIYLAFKVNKNVALSFDEIQEKVEEGLKTIKELNHEIEDTQKEVVFTMGAIGESRSKETGNHVKRVAEYSKLLALYYGLSKEEAELLKQASPMHDIGKVAIPDSILNKPGRFDEKERKIMNTHAKIGYEMLKHSNRPLLKAAAIISLEHHEKWDGTGYPKGLKEKEIHIYGRITAIADIFDALGSDRCYKKAWSDEKIFKLFKEEREKHFDPKLVDIFFEHLDEFLKIRDSFKDT
ncbi:HD-GYP domain-containing protein [Halarcobacter bivalviorum]|uniref:HD family phosphohydrolase n=1 Tax=Halarcobacter bivalviorum TaxID=663364 RepID=A0AAX2A7H0_9BACT|nr:HD domain-containing phosphohydrolase [Halarcobacter bivalviorum]AXH13610.1 response regulator c-di-GMP phosphodiesterase, RpfG family [Halarcobacter bivalviorum]RXK09785.1 HD family phosphohydrolase [Halarcobacter bivalviorum]